MPVKHYVEPTCKLSKQVPNPLDIHKFVHMESDVNVGNLAYLQLMWTN